MCGTFATTAVAVPETLINAGPELQSYICPKNSVTKDWTVKFGGGTGTYAWSVTWGDGNNRTGTTSNQQITPEYTFTNLGADGCRDFNQYWTASSGAGGSASDSTRVVWQR